MTEFDDAFDPLTIGRRVRSLRQRLGLTLEEFAERIGKAPSQVSVVENGRRELRLSELQQYARALEANVAELLDAAELSEREHLEIALAKLQTTARYQRLSLPHIPARKSLSDDTLHAIVGLFREIERMDTERAATPEQARRANTELRAIMRARSNYFEELEAQATDLRAAIGMPRGPLPQRGAAELASHLGFSLHSVPDLPRSTRSVLDRAHHRLYVPRAQREDGDQRTVVLQALAAQVLEHQAPANYADFLRQRVETNYLTGAILMPEQSCIELLAAAKQERQLSIEDLRDAFGVTYETAAHRFTNLATAHLDIPVHFLKVHESGTISKAYENDAVQFPADALGAVEGQLVCRQWSARRVFEVEDHFNPYHQYTDKPSGTYWCTSRVQQDALGLYSVSVGTPFEHVRWFRGRDTAHRYTSKCPSGACCQLPHPELSERWATSSFPSARMPSTMLAALPTGEFPGVDLRELYAFLERHAPASE
ncbi:helix-turn-helix domain-containing protein [Pseudoclavibacter alba]|uniref:XRE family transcriptional regulator n=1 Tax=Pseudoclavibacter albus TaxID=272241 RepID=UPI0019D23B76|nr:XRE family transcriptional regulator [Pseudoclavibacter alba]MBN6778476.1 helix-turn-helix domain-containing protein [Pseudoclavibacter alba]